MCENTTNQEKRKRIANLSENLVFSGRGEHTIRLNVPADSVFIENSYLFVEVCTTQFIGVYL